MVNSNLHNTDIPHFKALVRRSHFTHNLNDFDIFDNVYLFGIQSIPGKILTFHGMTDYGMLRSRIPIDQIFLQVPTNDVPNHYKQLWDCFSYNVNVNEFEFLCGKRCEVVLKDKTKVWASYLFTVDWFNNPYSDEPTDYKCGHILVSDNGYLLCQPNNRIFWKDPNWITKQFPMSVKDIKVDNELVSVEQYSDRWVSEDTDSFYYDINQ